MLAMVSLAIILTEDSLAENDSHKEFNQSNIKFGLILFTIGFVKKIFLAEKFF
mgnify:CR=1 FL=1